MLVVDNVSVRYGRVPALRDVSLTVNNGEIVSLIGANGAGKTSLLNTIAGIIAPTRGNIEWDGKGLLGLPSHRIVNAGIGYPAREHSRI